MGISNPVVVKVDNKTISLDANSQVQILPQYDLDNQTDKALLALEIIELQANATITPVDHNTIISDTFSDTDGYKNTVASGTTLPYTTGYYSCSSNSSEIHGVAMTTSVGSINWKSGNKITMKANANLVNITKLSTTTPTTGYLLDSSKNVIASASFVGDVCTFSSPQSLTNGTSYYLATGGNTRTEYYGSASIPNQGTLMNWVGGFQDTTDYNNQLYSIVSASFQSAVSTGIVNITLPTITGTVTHTELVANCPNRETGDSVTYKIKNATQNDTGLALNTKNVLTNLTSNPTGLEIILSAKSSSPTDKYPSVKSYCLKVWKV